MKLCPHFSLGNCKYPQACGIELILPDEKVSEGIVHAIDVEFALCKYKTIRVIRENQLAKKGVYN